MKQFYSILFACLSTFFFTTTVQASVTLTQVIILPDGPLCNASCDATISFPDGGTLTASESLVFTFGNGGEVSIGAGGSVNVAIQPASLVFPTGGFLLLEAGESITFDVGGFINTASSGNIEFTDIEVTTGVDIDVVLDAASTSITFADITATGSGVLSITANGDVFQSGNLIANNLDITIVGGSLTFNGSNNVESLTVSATGSLEFTDDSSNLSIESIDAGGNVTLTTAGTLETTGSIVGGVITTSSATETIECVSTTADDSGISITLGTIDPITTTNCTTLVVGTVNLVGGGTVGAGVLTITPVKKDGSGALNGGLLLLFFGLLFYSRRKSFSIR